MLVVLEWGCLVKAFLGGCDKREWRVVKSRMGNSAWRRGIVGDVGEAYWGEGHVGGLRERGVLGEGRVGRVGEGALREGS